MNSTDSENFPIAKHESLFSDVQSQNIFQNITFIGLDMRI